MNCAVTGINRGIGLELCRQLLEKGESVWGLTRNPETPALKELKTRFKDKFTIVKGDVTSAAEVKDFAVQLPAIDLLINNAGVLLDSKYNFENLPLDVVEQTLQVNLIGAMRVAQALVPKLLQSENSFVMNMSSLMGSIDDNAGGGYYAYRISKTALNMFNKSFSIDHPQITSIVTHPGWVQTDMGGSGATTPAKESAAGLLTLVYDRKRNMSGKFFDYRGKELSW